MITLHARKTFTAGNVYPAEAREIARLAKGEVKGTDDGSGTTTDNTDWL